MPQIEDVRMGIYRHHKGPLYQVIGLAHDANADTLYSYRPDGVTDPHRELGERTVVIYVPLQLDGAHLGPRMAVRTLSDFTATVQVLTGGLGSKDVPRFEYLGPALTADMLL